MISAKEKCCEYCGLTEAESFFLFTHCPESTRGGRRGKRLEKDRKNPFLPYDQVANIVDACYWCNNAKTNHFTYEEFKLIGPAIGEANRRRIKAIRQRLGDKDNEVSAVLP